MLLPIAKVSKFTVVLVLILLVAACQKSTFDTGGASKPKDSPEYSTQPNLNGGTSPLTDK